MQLAAVYGREIDDEITTFGTTGYTYDNTFLVYDRGSDSVWYPMGPDEMTAISGKMKGKSLPFITKPRRVKLSEWRAENETSVVLVK